MPHVRKSKSLGLWIPRHGFRIPGIRFQSLLVELGFRISIVSGILDSLCYFPDSKAQNSSFQKQNFPDSWFHRQNLPDLGIQTPFHGAKCQSLPLIYFRHCSIGNTVRDIVFSGHKKRFSTFDIDGGISLYVYFHIGIRPEMNCRSAEWSIPRTPFIPLKECLAPPSSSVCQDWRPREKISVRLLG